MVTDDDFEVQYLRATEAGRRAAETEPRARAARYDRATGQIVVELRNGATFIVPARLCQGLADAQEEDLMQVEITPSGYGLHWERLDADLSVPGLLMGLFGSEKWMTALRSELGRRGGARTSPAKARAARENGKRGGRPRKSAGG